MKKSLLITSLFLLAAFLLFLSQLVSLSPVLPFEKLNTLLFSGLMPTNLMPQPVFRMAGQAGGSASDNIRGWLWSENFGWVSTNCYNDYNGDKKFDNCCPSGTLCSAPNPPSDCCPLTSLAGGDYGLHYDANHRLIGYAWSANLGWLCFGPTCSGSSPDNKSAWACVGARKEDGNCLKDCEEDFNYNETCLSSSDPNLVGHWKMNEIYGKTPHTPSEVNNKDMKAWLGRSPGLGDEPKLISGRFRAGLSFDGLGGWAKVNDHSELDLTNNFTLEGWVYLKDCRPIGCLEQIMFRKDSAYALGVIPDTFNDFQARLFINKQWQTYSFTDKDLHSNYLNKWRHVALTYDGENVRLYLDGVLDSIHSQSGLVKTNDNPLYLGGEESGAHLYGYLDNLTIYSKVKTPGQIWQDAKKEVSGWAKIVSADSDKGWLKLADQTLKSWPPSHKVDQQFWGFYLDDYSQGGRFYTLGGQAFAESPPAYRYGWRTWAWSADLDNSGQKYGLGWLTGTHEFSYTGPQEFNAFSVQNLGTTPAQTSLSWQPSLYGQFYLFWRVQKDSAALCPACLGPIPSGYTPYLVPSDACDTLTCSTTDTDSLKENKGYCYCLQAWNFSGYKWATHNPPAHSHPYWLKIPLQPAFDLLVQGNICGRLELVWNPPGQELTVDGYSLYRSVRSNGCEPLTSPACFFVGALGEGLSHQNLVGHWKMNESSWNGTVNEVKDSSGFNHHGQAVNGASTTADEQFKRAGSFDGSNDYLLINDADSLDMAAADSFTLSAWIKTNDNNGGIIIQKIDTNQPGYSFEVSSNGKLKCFLRSPSQSVAVDSGTEVNNNQWRHVACVANRTNNTLQIYLDGKADGPSQSLTGIGSLANNLPLTIGGILSPPAGESYYLEGLLDNVSISKRAKSANEILFEAEAKPLTDASLTGACQIFANQPFAYGSSYATLSCAADNPCCQFFDRRVTPKTVYYYWLTETSLDGVSSAKPPKSGCHSVGPNYRYGCDQTLCAEKIEEREK